MKFGPVPVCDALGSIAAHTIRIKELLIRKGTCITEADILSLRVAGVSEITAARLEPGDVGENDAANALARAVAGDRIVAEAAFTGRSNLYAECAGVLLLDCKGIDSFNRIDETVTLATLRPFKLVREGEMIGTVKIIPFAISGKTQRRAMAVASPLLSVAPYRLKSVAVISTRLPGLAEKVIDKTIRVMENRLAPMGAYISSDRRIAHATAPLADAIRSSIRDRAELVVVFGASAIADRRDVIPSAIVEAAGVVEHFGMPVDPGNLMLTGKVDGVPVIGAPGCARSPKENGFDWLLARLVVGLTVSHEDIMALGVGGLLMEIVTRPQLREVPPRSDHAPSFAAIVLAAGRGTRMVGENKLLAEVKGKPIVRHAVEAALASKARPVVVVTGHDSDGVAQALKGLEIKTAHNPDYTEGLSTSLKAGLAALPAEVDAVAVMLGDMPDIPGGLIDKLLLAIRADEGALIAVPTFGGKRGNPVVWSRLLFNELANLSGDVGARHLIGLNKEAVVEVPVEDDAVFLDVDTQEALATIRVRR